VIFSLEVTLADMISMETFLASISLRVIGSTLVLLNRCLDGMSILTCIMMNIKVAVGDR